MINGYDHFERAQGKLNQYMVNLIQGICEDDFDIKTTNVFTGYKVDEELEKFKWADIVIIQTPIYWFSVPGILKKYMDDVFAPGVFFGKSSEFGRGGKLTAKKYMLSVTWGAKESVFNGKRDDFLEGLSEEQVLFPVHKTFEYCGLIMLPTFSIYSAMKLHSVESYKEKIQRHLNQYLLRARLREIYPEVTK